MKKQMSVSRISTFEGLFKTTTVTTSNSVPNGDSNYQDDSINESNSDSNSWDTNDADDIEGKVSNERVDEELSFRNRFFDPKRIRRFSTKSKIGIYRTSMRNSSRASSFGKSFLAKIDRGARRRSSVLSIFRRDSLILANDESTSIPQRNLAEKLLNATIIRKKIKVFLSTHVIGIIYTRIMVVLSVLSGVQLIYQSYFEYEAYLSPSSKSILDSFQTLELFLSGFFFCDWCLSFFLADHKFEFITGFYSTVDLLTCIPIVFTYFNVRPSFEQIDSFYNGWIYFMYALNVTRLLRSLRLRRYLLTIENEVWRHLGEMFLVFIVMILFDATLMHFLESDRGLTFNAWLYYTFVTLTTVGYGDIAPLSIFGRFAAMSYILMAITIVPSMTNALVMKMNATTTYARAFFNLRKNTQHVVICGDLSSTSLSDFFRELLHEDHEDLHLSVVIMQPESPSESMREILSDPVYSLNVFYLEGSALNRKDLLRARVDKAIGIFIMCDKNSSNGDIEDSKTLLQHFCIRRFLSSTSSNSFFCIQLIREESRRHLSENEDQTEVIVCLNEIKMGLIAKTSLYPGASTLLLNLVSSFSTYDEKEEEEFTKKGIIVQGGHLIDTLQESHVSSWQQEYTKGCDWEIYSSNLAVDFEGYKFCDISCAIYHKLGVLLIGLGIEELDGKRMHRIILNPGALKIPSTNDFAIECIVIAKNQDSADLEFKENPSILSQILLAVKTQQQDVSSSRDGSVVRTILDAGSSKTLNIVGNDLNNRKKAFRKLSGSKRKQSSENLLSVLLQRSMNATPNVQYTTREKLLAKKSFMSGRKGATMSMSMTGSFVSDQEKRQNEEDRYLERNYFRRSKAVDLKYATIKVSISEEFPQIKEHFIIVTKGLDNLYELVRPFRAKYLGKIIPIVILCPIEMQQSIWGRLSHFEAIFYYRGQGLEENDLKGAGIFKASRVIVLSERQKESGLEFSQSHSSESISGVSVAQESLVDSDAIFIYQLVRRMNEKTKVVLEIVHPSNISYLVSDSRNLIKDNSTGYRNAPHFAGGVIFTTSTLDSLVSQAFYNPIIIRVLTKLVGGADYKEEGELGADNLKTESKSKSKKRGLNDIISSCLYQIPCPDLQTKTYAFLFNKLASVGMIPVAILRGVFPGTGMGTRMNKLPYIYTNPHKEAEIFSCDRIFVLSQNPIELEGTNSFRPNKTQEEKNFDKELMKIFRKDIQRLEMSRKDFASRLNGLVKNIGIKTLSFESNVQKLLCCQNDLPEPETTLSSIRSLTLSTHS